MITPKKITITVKLLISLLLVLLVLRQIYFREVSALLQTAEPNILIVALAVVIANLGLAAYRWQILIAPGRPPSYLSLLRLLLISHAYNMFIPGSIAGDVYRSFKTTAATIVMDRLVGLVGMIILWLLGLAYSFSMLLKTGLLPYLASICLILCGSTIILLSRRLSRKMRWLGALMGPFQEKLKHFVLSLQTYRYDYRRLGLSLVLTLLAHLLLITATFLIGVSLQAPITFFNCLLFVPIIGLLSSLPISLGGLGIREASFVLLFSTIGVDSEVSISISFLFYFILVLIGIFGLGLSFLPAPRKKSDTLYSVTMNPIGEIK